jgi:hypothetical protein
MPAIGAGSLLKNAGLVSIQAGGHSGTGGPNRFKGHRMTFFSLDGAACRILAGAAVLSLVGCSGIPLTLAPVTEPKVAEVKVAEPKPSAGMVAPLVEKRETLTATGYAVISVQNHRNPAQQRLMAIRASKLDAYRSLTEQVYGQQLDATTTVADMMVQSDTFRTKVEGVIYGAVLVSITPAGDDTYETTLSLDRAVVQDLRALYLGQIVAKGR